MPAATPCVPVSGPSTRAAGLCGERAQPRRLCLFSFGSFSVEMILLLREAVFFKSEGAFFLFYIFSLFGCVNLIYIDFLLYSF